MRLWMAAILIGATALPMAACNREATTDDAASAPKVVETPKRKPGLWQQQTTMAGMPGIPAVSICIDKDADKKLAWWGQQSARGGCEKNDVTQNPDGSWSFESACDLQGGATTTTKGTATGDFKSAFQVKATTTTSGAPIPDMNGTHDVTIDYAWKGECPSNMKGGDMRLPDGSLVNLIDMAAAQQQAAQP